MMPFRWRARVYWEDTDGGGVVYYANYLRYLERARTEWLRAQGISQQSLARESGIVFAVTSVRIDYHRPARLDDELLIGCEAHLQGAALVAFEQLICRAGQAADADELLASAEVRVACVNAQSFRPQRLPVFMRAALAREPA